ncbi:MAG: hypothetical protein GF398_01315 [Chitinivibrionales bacterium]|nr:hypothetical protein [Chitinivibrionales bacterium]
MRIKLIAVVVLTGYTLSGSTCRFAETLWKGLDQRDKQELLREAPPRDSACLSHYIKRATTSPHLIRRGERFTKTLFTRIENSGHFPLDWLHALCMLPADNSGCTAWFGLWETLHGPWQQIGAQLRERGDIAGASQLMQAAEQAGQLRDFDFMRWAEYEIVLGNYDRAAQIICTAQNANPRIAPIMQNQLTNALRDAERHAITAALQSYQSCCFATHGLDTVKTLHWFRTACRRFHLEEQEVTILAGLPFEGYGIAERLAEIAHSRFSMGAFASAVRPAKHAYRRFRDKHRKAALATIIYQSFASQNITDSARIWLAKLDMQSPAHVHTAIILNQKAGLLVEAERLLAKVAPSRHRDTLFLRQCLYAHELKKAQAYIADSLRQARRWRTQSLELNLWRLRVLLFAQQPDSALQVLDSMRYPPSWKHAGEVLQYKYAAALMRGSPSELKGWAKCEYYLYLQHYEGLPARLAPQRYSTKAREYLLLRISLPLLEAQNSTPIVELLGRYYSEEVGTQYRFVYARALARNAEVEKARSILEKLIVEYPQDVFSTKARLLLQEFDQS